MHHLCITSSIALNYIQVDISLLLLLHLFMFTSYTVYNIYITCPYIVITAASISPPLHTGYMPITYSVFFGQWYYSLMYVT
jgi:hypothetical protein